MNLLTIIIPMFNEQDNIENCINSLTKQSNQNFVAIFIDDGSSDSTLLRLKRYLNQGISFEYKIIEQINKGAAAARQAGIKMSKTKFIMYFDCDDDISSDIIEHIYKEYNKNNDIDIVIPNMSIQKANGDWCDFHFYTGDIKLEPLDCVKESLRNWGVHGCFAIKKSIIIKSYEDYYSYNVNRENYINNDEVITRLNFSNSKEIVRIDSTYYYKHNLYSTTKKINNKKYLTIKNSIILNEIYFSCLSLIQKRQVTQYCRHYWLLCYFEGSVLCSYFICF